MSPIQSVQAAGRGIPRKVDAAAGGDRTQQSRAFELLLGSALTAAGTRKTGESASTADPPPQPVEQTVPPEVYLRQQAAVRMSRQSGLQKYRDDQLLSNPGGDRYYLTDKKVVAETAENHSFLERVGKDLADAAANVGNFFKNLFFGAKVHYRDQTGEIRESRRPGLLGSLVEFGRDLLGFVSLGAIRSAGEPAPAGGADRLRYAGGKLKEAIADDLVAGVGGSVNQMGEDLALAGWNLVETVPDATVGNLPAGERLTTGIFDNGQVVMDYATDVLPAGEAWLRVHSMDFSGRKAPVVNNIGMPEHHSGDQRWATVRNTPFRKVIEIVGSLLADVLTLRIIGRLTSSSGEPHTQQQ